MAVSELPGNPNAVWTVRRHVEGKNFLLVLSPGGPSNVTPGCRMLLIISSHLNSNHLVFVMSREHLQAPHFQLQ